MRQGLVNRVVWTDQKVGADGREPICRRKHELANAGPIISIETTHVVRKRRRVHRHLGMAVRPEQLRAFSANRPIAESRAFRGTRHDADVFGHQLFVIHLTA